MLKILVVDDENLVRVALRSIVNWEEHGFDFVGTAGDGLEALVMVDKHCPDIVVTDLKMPNMDGIQLIKALKERQFNGKILILSNYGDFELVKQALMLGAADYILKVTLIADDFINTLKNIRGNLSFERKMKDEAICEQKRIKQSSLIVQNNFFTEFFRGKFSFDYQRITIEAQEAGLRPTLPKSFMYYIHIDDRAGDFNVLRNEDHKQLIFAIRNIISECLSRINNFYIIEIGDQCLIILIPVLEFLVLESKPEELARKLANTFLLYLNVSTSMIITDEFDGLYGAKEAYDQCIKIIKLKFYTGDGSIIHLASSISDKLLDEVDYAEQINNLWHYFQQDSINDMVAFINNLLEKAKNKQSDPIILKKTIMRLIESIENEIYKSKLINLSMLEKLKEQICNAETLPIFQQLVLELINNMYIIWRKTDTTGNYRKEVREIIQFINDNLKRRITISMIAQHVRLNESYICRIFKIETKKSIFTYINEARMEKAAMLLRDKSILIKDIAFEVGIEDQFYFNKVFRKHFGVNPTSYRNNHQ